MSKSPAKSPAKSPTKMVATANRYAPLSNYNVDSDGSWYDETIAGLNDQDWPELPVSAPPGVPMDLEEFIAEGDDGEMYLYEEVKPPNCRRKISMEEIEDDWVTVASSKVGSATKSPAKKPSPAKKAKGKPTNKSKFCMPKEKGDDKGKGAKDERDWNGRIIIGTKLHRPSGCLIPVFKDETPLEATNREKFENANKLQFINNIGFRGFANYRSIPEFIDMSKNQAKKVRLDHKAKSPAKKAKGKKAPKAPVPVDDDDIPLIDLGGPSVKTSAPSRTPPAKNWTITNYPDAQGDGGSETEEYDPPNLDGFSESLFV